MHRRWGAETAVESIASMLQGMPVSNYESCMRQLDELQFAMSSESERSRRALNTSHTSVEASAKFGELLCALSAPAGCSW